MNTEFKTLQIQGADVKVVSFRLCKVEVAKTLPQIESNLQRPRFVFWASNETIEGGMGDDQVWAWFPGASYYVPMQRASYLNGVPTAP